MYTLFFFIAVLKPNFIQLSQKAYKIGGKSIQYSISRSSINTPVMCHLVTKYKTWSNTDISASLWRRLMRHWYIVPTIVSVLFSINNHNTFIAEFVHLSSACKPLWIMQLACANTVRSHFVYYMDINTCHPEVAWCSMAFRPWSVLPCEWTYMYSAFLIGWVKVHVELSARAQLQVVISLLHSVILVCKLWANCACTGKYQMSRTHNVTFMSIGVTSVFV